MSNSHLTIVQKLDGYIRNGEGDRVRSELQKLCRSKISRELRPQLASIARRVGLVELSVRLLSLVIFPPDGSPSNSSEDERAEYSAGLIKLGAVQEGMQILKSLDSSNSKFLFFRGIGCISEWNYADAIPLFEKALAGNDFDDYQRLVCRGNLSAALVHQGRFTEATNLLMELLPLSKDTPVVHANILKYWAELKIETKDVKGARNLLDGAEQVLTYFGGRDALLVRKWKAVLDIISSGGNKETVNHLQSIQNEAKEKKHWETIRDCDYYKAIYTHDLNSVLKLYFGTPYTAYKKRLLEKWKKPIEIPDSYTWVMKGESRTIPIQILSGEKAPSGNTLKTGQCMHSLLKILSSDFYRPFRLASIHSALYPGERFNPISSPSKVQSWIGELRKWLRTNKLPLTILVQNKDILLEPLTACSLVIPNEKNAAHSLSEHSLQKLMSVFQGDFSISEAHKMLDVSNRTALGYLQQGVAEGILTRTGKARATRYRFLKEAPKKVASNK